MSLELFMQRVAAQQQREADEIANSKQLTLDEAIALEKTKIATNRQSTLQIKNWYKQGYYMRSNNMWYNSNGSRKYSTC